MAHKPATSGACLDSSKVVPMNLGPGDGVSSDIVRIDLLVWHSAGGDQMIGFIYRVHNGTAWIGTRKAANTTEQGLAQFSTLLASVRARPDELEYPVTSRYNGAIQYEVRNVDSNLSRFDLRASPCVVWPADKDLP